MTRQMSPRRSGATLIELMVVISIMVVLATLAAMVLPALRQKNNSVKAASQVSGYFSLAKQRALRDQAPRGIRLIRDINDPTIVREIQFIEQPDAIVPVAGSPVGLNLVLQPVGTQVQATLLNANNTWLGYGVQPGDYLFATYNDTTFVAPIVGVGPTNTLLVQPPAYSAFPGQPVPVFAPPPLFTPVPPPVLLTDGFKVVRKPRALVGEANLQLPPQMVIDLNLCQPNPGLSSWNSLADPLDVIFLPSGEISGCPEGMIILYVRPEDNTAGEPTLICIYTRTGQIILHPVAVGPDPYFFARDGKGSGL